MQKLLASGKMAGNSLALLLAQLYTILLGVLLVPVLTRYLGRAGYGTYTATIAFTGLFSVIGHLGLNVILTRELAKQNRPPAKLFGQVITLKIALGLAYLIVVLLMGIWQADTSFAYTLLALCALSTALQNFANTMFSVFRAREVMGYELTVVAADRTTWAIGLLIVVWLDLGLLAIFVALLVSAIVRLITSIWLSFYHVNRPTLGINLSTWRWLLRETWPVGGSQGLRHAYERVGIVQLDSWTNEGAVGLFSGANRIYQIISTAASSISTALFPSISAAAERSSEKGLENLTSLGLKVMLFLTLPATIFLLFFADQTITWFLGAEFQEGVLALQILSPAVVLAAVNTLWSDLLRATNRQRYDLICIVIGLGLNFGINALLIPHWTYLAPSIAMVASQGVQFVLALFGVAPTLKQFRLRSLVAPLIAALAMAGVWWVTDSLPTILRLPIGFSVYGALILLLGGISPSTIRLIFTSMLRLIVKPITGSRDEPTSSVHPPSNPE